MTFESEKINANTSPQENCTIKTMEQRLLLEQRNLQILKELANQHFSNGNFYRALNYYMRLLSFEPHNARIWNKIAVVFLKLGKNQAAMEMSRVAYRLITKNQENVSNC